MKQDPLKRPNPDDMAAAVSMLRWYMQQRNMSGAELGRRTDTPKSQISMMLTCDRALQPIWMRGANAALLMNTNHFWEWNRRAAVAHGFWLPQIDPEMDFPY